MNLLKKFINGLNLKVFVFLGIFCGVITILIVGILIVRDFFEDRSIDKVEQIKMAYNIDLLDKAVADQTHGDFLYFEDLDVLQLDVELYRKTVLPWSHKDVGEYWIPADKSDLDYFTEANHELIWEILKDAP